MQEYCSFYKLASASKRRTIRRYICIQKKSANVSAMKREWPLKCVIEKKKKIKKRGMTELKDSIERRGRILLSFGVCMLLRGKRTNLRVIRMLRN